MYEEIVQPTATGTALPKEISNALGSLEVAISVIIARYSRDFEPMLSEQPNLQQHHANDNKRVSRGSQPSRNNYILEVSAKKTDM
jgi:hypothetical protein